MSNFSVEPAQYRKASPLQLLKNIWGYDGFRPIQEESINAILGKQDSLIVLPTGGGKSLCFQIPALLMDGMAVVLSPLISLMKDQVDGLKEMGVEAASLNSSLDWDETRETLDRVRAGRIKILYIAPERLRHQKTLELLKQARVTFFVIDEAHCISHWGHDFREDYRQLGSVKSLFPDASIHAFTATATQEVQKDILDQLQLTDPVVRIAPIDRENLTYRILPRDSASKQVLYLLEQHAREAGIIYCIRRDDVEKISLELNRAGHKNVPYHAGLPDEVRRKHQELFSQEKVNLVVATVAFGMGIDRSNIRFVIHTAMPKNIEHYQQETGRAGRDGLPAACTLLYSGADYRTWETILGDSPQKEVMMEKLNAFYRFCTEPQCRHKAFSSYFGQTYPKDNCDACDYCLKEMEMVEEPLIAAQKILSCVWRVNQRFGADHVANVLAGQTNENIVRWEHDKLSTFGIMPDSAKSTIRSLIEQLVGQNYLRRDPEYSTLVITSLGQSALKGKSTPVLAKPLAKEKKKAVEKERRQRQEQSWGPMDQELFAKLREKRMELAMQKSVPAFIIFGDKSLKEMAVRKPKTVEAFAQIYGVGERKCAEYAEIFLSVIRG